MDGGITGFYTGIAQDTSKTIADSFLFFLVYNLLRQTWQRNQSASSKHLSVIDELSIGFIAGALAKVVTTPLSNVVTRKQIASMRAARSAKQTEHARMSARSISHQIYAEKGLQGFWSGYSASLVLTLNPSLTFFFYETFKRLILHKEQRAHPPPGATFFLAAISKAIATTITYPFSLAKARTQVSSKTMDTDDSEVKDTFSKASNGKTGGTFHSRKAARTIVFGTIVHIAKTEGVNSLYEGLVGEVLKGFLSHGITMIIKEAIHKFIIQLYYAILRLLKQYPNPQQLTELAQREAGQVMIDARHIAHKRSTTLASNIGDATATISNTSRNEYTKARDSAGQAAASIHVIAQEGAANLTTQVTEAVNTISSATISTYQDAKDTAGNLYIDASQASKRAADRISQQSESQTANSEGHAIRPEKDVIGDMKKK